MATSALFVRDGVDPTGMVWRQKVDDWWLHVFETNTLRLHPPAPTEILQTGCDRHRENPLVSESDSPGARRWLSSPSPSRGRLSHTALFLTTHFPHICLACVDQQQASVKRNQNGAYLNPSLPLFLFLSLSLSLSLSLKHTHTHARTRTHTHTPQHTPPLQGPQEVTAHAVTDFWRLTLRMHHGNARRSVSVCGGGGQDGE